MKRKRSLRTLLYTVSVFVLCLLMISPFFIMISTSLKTHTQVTQWPPQWIAENPQWNNYHDVWAGEGNIRHAFFNSIFVSGSTMLLCMVLGTLGAYAVTRFSFRGKNLFLFTIIVTQMFSAVILIAPMYSVLRDLKLLNTYLSMIIPNTAFALPMTVWLVHGYMKTIPVSLEEAAMLDGCSRLQAVFRIVMPQLAPGILTSGLFAFIVSWNDLLFARTFITESKYMTLSVALTRYSSLFETYWHQMMAASVISVIPVFFLFTLIQKHLVAGLAGSGTTG